jgi:hypothetical protein
VGDQAEEELSISQSERFENWKRKQPREHMVRFLTSQFGTIENAMDMHLRYFKMLDEETLIKKIGEVVKIKPLERMDVNWSIALRQGLGITNKKLFFWQLFCAIATMVVL